MGISLRVFLHHVAWSKPHRLCILVVGHSPSDKVAKSNALDINMDSICGRRWDGDNQLCPVPANKQVLGFKCPRPLLGTNCAAICRLLPGQ